MLYLEGVMPALQCEASIVIDAPLEKVHSEITDFHRWPLWSPWLYVEPEASIEYQGTAGELGHSYHWKGNKTGEGQMSLRAVDTRSIDADLTFLKPFRSKADVGFRLEALEKERTHLCWSMLSQLPWFMFFMKATMSSMIRSDYQRGLLMLKDLVETGAVPSKTTTEGVIKVSEQAYVGQRRSTSMDGIGNAIENGLVLTSKALEAAGSSSAGAPFVLYESMDMKESRCIAVVALPTETSVGVSGDFVSRVRASGETLKFTHTGAYRHLGNAWHQAMGEMKARKLKAAAKAPPFEIYLTDPDSTPEAENITEIHLPLR